MRRSFRVGRDVRRVEPDRVPGEHVDMDPLSMVILAICSLACLQVAAYNLRGTERRHRVQPGPRQRR